MAYQSIFSSGQVPAPTKPVSTSGSSFKYVAPAPTVKKIDPNSIKDVPTLNNAFKVGQINKDQYMQRLKQFTGADKKAPTSFGVEAIKAYAPSVINEQQIQPVKNTLVGAVNKAKSQVSYLSGPTSTQQQRDVIINNQKAAHNNPAIAKNINKSAVTPSGVSQGNSAQGLIQAEKMAKQGKSAQEIQSFLAKDRQAFSKQTGQGINTIATIAGFSVPGEGIISKVAAKTGLTDAFATAKGTVASAIGKDEATNALIASQRASNATKAATVADKLGSSSIKEATTPKTTKIPVKGESTQVSGKVIANPDSQYIKASNKLSAQYEKDLAKVQKVPHPVTQKVLQVQLDRKYQGLQADLDNKFGQTSVSFTGRATPAENAPKLPRSALDSQTEPSFSPQTSPTTGVGPKTVPDTTQAPKEAPTASTQAVAANTGAKVSGSALKAEQRAVQSGLVKEFPDKATYEGVSYKQDAEDAVRLAHESPEEAKAIASGYRRGRTQAYDVAVRSAVENKAKKEGDVDTIMQLGNSHAHTRTSEAGQTLGAEAYNANKNSAVEAIKEIAAARKTTKAKQLKQTPDKAIRNTVKEIKAQPALKVSRQDWHSFVQDLRCK